MNSEKERLIQAKDSVKTGTRSLLWKYSILCTGIFVFLLGGLMYTNVLNEWVQHKIHTDKFPNLTLTKLNGSNCGVNNNSDPAFKNSTIIQQDSAHWLMYFNIALHIPMFFMNLFLNTYTDTYGRKLMLNLSLMGSCVKHSVICTVIYLNQSMWYIVGAYAIDGTMGSFYGTLAGSFAYIADITDKQEYRVLGIVGLEATIMASAVVGSELSGYLIQTLNLGFSLTSLICTIITIVGLSIFIFLVPESLPQSKRTPAKPFIETLKTMFQFYVNPEFIEKRFGYIVLLFSFFTAEIANLNRSNMETLYVLGLPFCWDPARIGTFLSVKYAAQGIVGLLALKLMQCCLSNEFIAILGAMSNAGSFVVEALATTDIVFYMVPAVGVLSFISIPLIRGMMSVITDPDKQGAMFSSIAAVEVLSSLISSTADNEIYAATYAFMQGFVFLLLGGLCIINVIQLIIFYIWKKTKYDIKQDFKNYKKLEI